MAQSVIVKKKEKVKKVFESMNDVDDREEFKRIFKEMYPSSWENVVQRYNEHEIRDKKGKGHPMPKPEIYLDNMFKCYRAKTYMQDK